MLQGMSLNCDNNLLLETNTATSFQFPQTHLKNIIIQEHHNNTGHVERAQRRVYHIVRVVEEALVGAAVRRVIQAQHHRRADGARHQPRDADHRPHSAIAFVLRVLYRLGHCYVSANKRSCCKIISDD